jgi:hypothetical protein
MTSTGSPAWIAASASAGRRLMIASLTLGTANCPCLRTGQTANGRARTAQAVTAPAMARRRTCGRPAPWSVKGRANPQPIGRAIR